MLSTLEKPETIVRRFDEKLYFLCVKRAASMSKAELSRHIDRLLVEITKNGPENMPEIVKEQAAIFAFLALRRKK